MSRATASFASCINYFCQRWYYVLIAFIVWLSLLLVGCSCYFGLASLICLLFFARLCDDLFDYRKDRGKRLRKSLLQKSLFFTAVIFLLVEILQYRFWGLLGILPLLYIFLMNYFNILKLFVVPACLGYILFISDSNITKTLWIILIALIINLILTFWKESRKHA